MPATAMRARRRRGAIATWFQLPFRFGSDHCAPMKVLVVDDEPAVRDAARARAAARRLRRRARRATAREALGALADVRARRGGARRADARAGRPRGLPAHARRRRPHAGADADRARRRVRPRRGPRRGRRRLPGQAVRAGGAARAAAGAAAPRRAASDERQVLRFADLELDPARTRCGAATGRSS